LLVQESESESESKSKKNIDSDSHENIFWALTNHFLDRRVFNSFSMPRQRTSPVYGYFESLESGSMKCNVCSTELTFVSSANCEKHLKGHPTEWAEYQQIKAERAELPPSKSTPSSSRKRKIGKDQPLFSFELTPKKSLSEA